MFSAPNSHLKFAVSFGVILLISFCIYLAVPILQQDAIYIAYSVLGTVCVAIPVAAFLVFFHAHQAYLYREPVKKARISRKKE